MNDQEFLEKKRRITDPVAKYSGNELEYVMTVLDSEDRASREVPFAARLEKAFRERFGVKHGIAHNSGTSTLHTCLVAAGVGAGDEVISPAHTVIMNTFATLYVNAIPVYVDCDEDTFLMDPKEIERKITPRTKAIQVVHMHGACCDMDPIMAIAKKHNLAVIEDAAQCVLGEYKGKLAGTIGDMASFSFEFKKHLSAGEGGIVITNNSDYATTIRKTAGLGYKTLTADSGLRNILPSDFQNPHYKRHDTLGWNYRMPEIVAAVALAQTERMDFLVRRRQEIATYYLEAIEGCDWIVPQKLIEGTTHTYWSFPVRYEGEAARGVTWRQFYDMHKANGGHGFYGGLSVVHDEPIVKEENAYLQHYLPEFDRLYRDRIAAGKERCPRAESFQPKMMIFKTNYRDLKIAREKIDILRKTIKDVESAATKTRPKRAGAGIA